MAPGALVRWKAGLVEFYGGWLRAFPDAHIDVSDVYFVDDIAVEEGTFSGTHDGVLHTPSEDVPPIGRAISVPYIHVLRYRDGLHVAFNLVFDRLLMLKQLGLVPAPRRCSDARTEGGSHDNTRRAHAWNLEPPRHVLEGGDRVPPHRAVLAERSTERNHLDSPAAGASIAATRSGSKRREE